MEKDGEIYTMEYFRGSKSVDEGWIGKEEMRWKRGVATEAGEEGWG